MVKLPKYVEQLSRFMNKDFHQEGEPGYTWRLSGKYPYGRNGTLTADAERIVRWAERNYAVARIICEVWPERRGTRPYVVMVITDPVTLWIEKFQKEAQHVKITHSVTRL